MDERHLGMGFLSIYIHCLNNEVPVQYRQGGCSNQLYTAQEKRRKQKSGKMAAKEDRQGRKKSKKMKTKRMIEVLED